MFYRGDLARPTIQMDAKVLKLIACVKTVYLEVHGANNVYLTRANISLTKS